MRAAIKAALAWLSKSRTSLACALKSHSASHTSKQQGQPEVAPRSSSSSSSVSSLRECVTLPQTGDDQATNSSITTSNGAEKGVAGHIGRPSSSMKNTSVPQSAVVSLAALQAEWSSQQQAAVIDTSTAVQQTGSKDVFGHSSSSRTSSSTSSSSRRGNWQQDSTFSEAVECWNAGGLTARLSAAAAVAAAPSRSQQAAGALNALHGTGCLPYIPLQKPQGRCSNMQGGPRKATHGAWARRCAQCNACTGDRWRI